VPGIIAVRVPDLGTLASDFFEAPLFVWFAGALLAVPQLFERAAAASAGATTLVRIGFGIAVLIGLWLTYVGWIAEPAASPAKDNP